MWTRDNADSWYVATAADPPVDSGSDSASLDTTVDADVCIIGGGFTGISAALHMAERGLNVVVLEAEYAGWGASGRNGGQLGSGQRLDPEALEKKYGKDLARTLWELGEEAKAGVHERIAQHGIDCHYRPGLLYTCLKAREVAAYRHHAEHLNREYAYDAIRFVERGELRAMLGTDIYHGGVLDTGAGHLHPLNLCTGLARAARGAGARIFERSPATGYERRNGVWRVDAPSGQVRAEQLVLAANAYLGALEPRIAPQIMPINNFIAVTEPLGEAGARALIRDDVAVADSKFVVDYYRTTHDHRLLFGGGESYGRRMPENIAERVRPIVTRVFPDLIDVRFDYAWGGTVAITMNRMPAWGRLDRTLWYVHGYSGHGVALANLAGKLLAEATSGEEERFDLLASLPTRDFPGGTWLRWPGQVAGMMYYSLRDRLV